MAEDWDTKQTPGHIFKAVNLWRFLQCCPKSMSDIGVSINGESKHADDILMGYSLGGRLALHALLDQPSKWKKAIIISAHTGLLSEQEKSERRAIDAEWGALALTLEWPEFLKKWNSQQILPPAELPSRAKLKPFQQQVARSFIDWSTGAQENLLPRLHEIKTEVLWITGEQDTKFTKVAAAACEQLPNATHSIVKNVGHRVPWEAHDIFYQMVNEFIKE